MLEMMKKTMFTGLGLALKTRDEVESFAKDWTKKREMSEDEGRSFISDLMKRYDDSFNKLEGQIEKTVREVMRKTNIATREELDQVKKANRAAMDEILLLKREVERLREEAQDKPA